MKDDSGNMQRNGEDENNYDEDNDHENQNVEKDGNGMDEWGFDTETHRPKNINNQKKKLENKSISYNTRSTHNTHNTHSEQDRIPISDISDRDSRPFVRPDSRANSRGSLRQNASDNINSRSVLVPVNLSGLSGFRTGGAEEEEEEDYGNDDFNQDNYDNNH